MGHKHYCKGMWTPSRWFCSGCQKEHAGTTERNTALDGKSYCNRQWYKLPIERMGQTAKESER